MTQVAIAVLLFGAGVFGLGMWAARALRSARVRSHQHSQKEMSGFAGSHTLGRSA